MSSSFTSIPLLRLRDAVDPSTKPSFLDSLRSALLEVGFLYLDVRAPTTSTSTTTSSATSSSSPSPNAENVHDDDGKTSSEKKSETDKGHAVFTSPDLTDAVIAQCRAFFEDLPDRQKLDIEMKKEKSFLGYSRLGNEITAGASDWREQLDLSTPHPLPEKSDPIWFNLRAPNQWPSSEHLPEFRAVFEEYIDKMAGMSMFFTTLIAEAIGLESNAFDKFFDKDQQHKLKLVKYPDNGDGVGQGVGPHKDSMLSSYLLQASHHKGLQAQNKAGEWIDVPPIDGTVVVAMGQGIEAVTSGVVASTTHRVLSPSAGSGARYSIPFFQGVSFGASFQSVDVPQAIRTQKQDILDRAGVKERLDDVEFTFKPGRWSCLGEATFQNRIKSHVDVSERWYPERLAIMKQIEAEERQAKQSQLDLKQDARLEPSAASLQPIEAR